MRLLLDSLIALMLALVLGGLVLHQHQQRQKQDRREAVHQALAQLHETMLYRAAIREVATSPTGFPMVISPLWFEHEVVPANELVPGRQPWIDLASPGDMSNHPPDPVITSSNQAGFWYNPYRGLIRARVMPQYSDAATVEMYNLLNGEAITSFDDLNPDVDQTNPQRMPLVATTPDGHPTTQVQATPRTQRLRRSPHQAAR